MTHEAFCKLDLLVVSELFPTPTSEVADIVLPVAWGAEHDSLGYWPGWHEEIRAYPKVVEPPGEARSVASWISKLAKRLGTDAEPPYDWKPDRLSWPISLTAYIRNNLQKHGSGKAFGQTSMRILACVDSTEADY